MAVQCPPQQSILLLTSVCSADPAVTRRWRVRNVGSPGAAVNFTYDVFGTAITGMGTVPAGIGQEVFFETPTQPGPNTTRIFIDGCLHDTKASGGAQCPAPPPTVVALLPVDLAVVNVQVNVDSFVTLPEPALEIKNIKKNLKITQCLLLIAPNTATDSAPLFLKGFVRKNIIYATRSCSNTEGVCGDIRHCTVDVPFSCTTMVTFNGAQPILPQANTVREFEFFKKQKLRGPGFADKDELLSGDLSEYNQVSEEHFNQLPYCELIDSRIVEFDEFLNRTKPYGAVLPFEEKEFRKIEEKMILRFTIKILQNQQVVVTLEDNLAD